MNEKNSITEGKTVRDFKLTRLSLENRNTVILMTILLAIFGFLAYKSMPRELFPEVNIPFIFVKTVYPGNAPIDMENLITRPLEKEIHTVTGIKELRSKSTQDSSDIFIEFNTDVKISDALQDVKDAVDKAKSELPDDLDMDPLVMDFDFNEFPIINVNLSGDYSLDELKDYAEYLEDELEAIPEISKVEIKGLDEREIQINVDPYKLESFQLSFSDIEDAVNFENISISGGDLVVDKTTRSIRTIGEFTDIKEIENIIVKRESTDEIVYLRDVAEVKDGFEDPLTYARLDRKPVVSLQVVKKAGENLLIATDKLFAVLAETRQSGAIPNDLNINLSNDQSEFIRDMINNLENSIIMGFIFVVLVLLFFLGLRNALLVGISAGSTLLGLRGWKMTKKIPKDLFQTFQIVPAVVDVNDEKDWIFLAQVVEHLGETNRGYGIPAGGGAVYHPDWSFEAIRHHLVEYFYTERQVKRSLIFPKQEGMPEEDTRDLDPRRGKVFKPDEIVSSGVVNIDPEILENK